VGRKDGPVSYRRRFRPEPDSARAARRFARECLRELGLDDHGYGVGLLVGEMAVNAILHAHTDYQVALSQPAPGTVRVEVLDGNLDLPRQKDGTGSDTLTYGRGLTMIQALSSRWGVTPSRAGKTVWAEIDP
jgi:anti-sigma regulatory factor (Ser/Thr protein kinase)